MRRIAALAIITFLLAGCGASLTDRFEGTYAIADFELDGATRERSKSNEAWYTTAEGSYGITQNFTPEANADAALVLDAALAAAELFRKSLRESDIPTPFEINL